MKNQASKMIKVGSAVRRAREEGRDPVEAFVKAAPAYKLFEGEVENFTLQKTGGFAHGDLKIRGTGKFTGHKFRNSLKQRLNYPRKASSYIQACQGS